MATMYKVRARMGRNSAEKISVIPADRIAAKVLALFSDSNVSSINISKADIEIED